MPKIHDILQLCFRTTNSHLSFKSASSQPSTWLLLRRLVTAMDSFLNISKDKVCSTNPFSVGLGIPMNISDICLFCRPYMAVWCALSFGTYFIEHN